MRLTASTLFFVGLFLLGVGCRTDQNLVLLERENRELEDALFQLEYDLEVCREENAALQEANATGGRDDGSADDPPDSKAVGPALDTEQLRPPSVELGPTVSPSDQLPKKFHSPGRPDTPDLPEAPRFKPPEIVPEPSAAPPENAPGGQPMPAEKPVSFRGGSKSPLVESHLVARVTIDSEQTAAFEIDGKPGADGLVTVIQPRAEDGRLLRSAAPVSVVLLDPALRGESARVARWDFSADEVTQAYDRSASAGGLHLEMLWPDEPPVNNRLHLFVRFTTADGRECQWDNKIEIDPPRDPAQEWLASRPAAREPQVASRDAPDWRRWRARIWPPAAIDPTPRLLPPIEGPVRTASRLTGHTAAPIEPTLAEPTRAWVPPPARPAVPSPKDAPPLLDKPVVAPVGSLLADGQSEFDTAPIPVKPTPIESTPIESTPAEPPRQPPRQPPVWSPNR